MAELVAGHSQDNEPLAGVSLVELVHLGVIPGGRTSERRDVLDKDHLPSQGGEFERFSRQQVCRKLVEVSRHIVLLVTLSSVPLLPPNFLNAAWSPWFSSVTSPESVSTSVKRVPTPYSSLWYGL